jgi:hypothetical protein
MAEARPALAALACPGGALRFGGIVAAVLYLRSGFRSRNISISNIPTVILGVDEDDRCA